MCNNPIAHPELRGNQPFARRALPEQQSKTLCGQHNEEAMTLEDALESMGVPATTVVLGIPPEAVCTNCTHIRTRLN